MEYIKDRFKQFPNILVTFYYQILFQQLSTLLKPVHTKFVFKSRFSFIYSNWFYIYMCLNACRALFLARRAGRCIHFLSRMKLRTRRTSTGQRSRPVGQNHGTRKSNVAGQSTRNPVSVSDFLCFFFKILTYCLKDIKMSHHRQPILVLSLFGLVYRFYLLIVATVAILTFISSLKFY